MNIAEEIIAHLRQDVMLMGLVGDRISQGTVNQGETFPRIWLERSSAVRDFGVNIESDDLRYENFNVECVGRVDVGDDGVKDALDVADAVKAAIDGYRGVMGFTTIKGAFIEDHDDSYVPRAVDDLDGFYIAALEVQIIY